jgi:ornithine cyclodeaminase/alanine dehydrogenase
MTIFLTDDDVRAVFDWQSAIQALRAAYSGAISPARYPARSLARGDTSWLRIMSGASAESGLIGAKLISVNLARQRASYLIPLFDQDTVELVALLDGHSITGFRTAATTAVAADLLAPAGEITLAVIGSGFEARHHVRALAAVRKVAAVNVFSPRASSRQLFAENLADLGLTIHAHARGEEAVAEADTVVAAARALDGSPTLLGTWLRPGQTVLSIGSTLPDQREVDPDGIGRADVIVADMLEEIVHDTGDLIAAAAAGIDVSGKITGLADVAGGRHPGRTSVDQIVLYKSVGSGIQDLTLATLCLRRAQERGIGTELPVTIGPVQK